MLPKIHALVGFIIGILLYFFTPISLMGAIIFFFSSFLIDFDHYLYYVYAEKNLKLKRAYNWFKIKSKKFAKLPKEERKKHRGGFYCFHGLEPIIIFILLGRYVLNSFYFVALGMFLHLILDWISIFRFNQRIHKFSIIYDFFKKGNYKKI